MLPHLPAAAADDPKQTPPYLEAMLGDGYWRLAAALGVALPADASGRAPAPFCGPCCAPRCAPTPAATAIYNCNVYNAIHIHI